MQAALPPPLPPPSHLIKLPSRCCWQQVLGARRGAGPRRRRCAAPGSSGQQGVAWQGRGRLGSCPGTAATAARAATARSWAGAHAGVHVLRATQGVWARTQIARSFCWAGCVNEGIFAEQAAWAFEDADRARSFCWTARLCSARGRLLCLGRPWGYGANLDLYFDMFYTVPCTACHVAQLVAKGHALSCAACWGCVPQKAPHNAARRRLATCSFIGFMQFSWGSPCCCMSSSSGHLPNPTFGLSELREVLTPHAAKAFAAHRVYYSCNVHWGPPLHTAVQKVHVMSQSCARGPYSEACAFDRPLFSSTHSICSRRCTCLVLGQSRYRRIAHAAPAFCTSTCPASCGLHSPSGARAPATICTAPSPCAACAASVDGCACVCVCVRACVLQASCCRYFQRLIPACAPPWAQLHAGLAACREPPHGRRADPQADHPRAAHPSRAAALCAAGAWAGWPAAAAPLLAQRTRRCSARCAACSPWLKCADTPSLPWPYKHNR